MSDNSAIPYMLQLKDAVSAIHLSENDISNIGLSLSQPTHITFVPDYNQAIEKVCVEPKSEVVRRVADPGMDIEHQEVNEQANFVYEIVYPEELNLKPVGHLKRGRPKRKKVKEPKVESPKPVKPVPRTRSGRAVKFPKYIVKDFKKVETEDGVINCNEQDVKVSEFVRFEEENQEIKTEKEIKLEFHQRKRKISGQYLCPKCKKAYLGKTKMIQHLKKYPDHGPLPRSELNFDVWNYLVDITQKCPPAQRGIKFCEELTNVLHNVLLLTSALFKKVELNKNYVDVDKVLGNAIGLSPGPYKFNENALYKDVTVLKLISNSDFFQPVNASQESACENKNSEIVSVQCGENGKDIGTDAELPLNTTTSSSNDFNGVDIKKKTEMYFGPQNDDFSDGKVQGKEVNDESECNLNGRSDDINNFDTNNLDTPVHPTDNRLSVHADMLPDTSLLNSPNLRNSVDDLILSAVDSGTNLLDNSASSDEVMNVDQFVNERFKKITEPEIGINGPGINLDLPSLDLFQFHPS